MKKFISLFALLLILIGCDDGDMTFETFNFADATPQICSSRELLYKTNGTEALLLDVDFDYFANFAKDTTFTLPANSIIYRNYTGTVSGSSVICAGIPPANPQVVEEWFSLAGAKLNVFSALVNDNEGNPTGYSHTITIKSAEFNKGDEIIVIENSSYGTFTTNLSYDFDFPSETTISKCDNTNVLYKRNLNESLLLDLTTEVYEDLFPNQETDTPRTQQVDPNDNRVIFDVYTGNITDNVICGSVPPVTPTILERWNATGTISVTTNYNETTMQYEHSVKLIDVEFTNSLNSEEHFEFAEFDLGIYTTE